MKWVTDIFIALDQLANALLLGAPDETLSSRAYRADRDKKIFGRVFRPMIDLLFFWEYKHCYQSYLAEVSRKQYPSNFR
jgi:hypothetical protein